MNAVEAQTSGLGWPATHERTAGGTGIGWPTTHRWTGLPVSRETSKGASDPGVSRETAYSHVPTAASIATDLPDFDREDFADTPIARQAQVALRGRAAVSSGNWPRPAKPRVFVVANQKGGVGKTTTAVNLAASLALNQLRVLVVDLDPQGNASTALGIEHRSGTPSVYEALAGTATLADVAQPAVDVPLLSCVPATIDLAGSEIELVPMVARESRLKRAIDPLLESPEFDYVFVDCPPSLGLLTVNAMVASHEVLIPIQCEYYALEGLGQLLHNIDMVKSHLNTGLEVSTIVLTMYDGRTRLSSQVADEVREHFGDRVLSTVVPRSVRISEAPSYGQTVMTYDPGSTGALSYLEAAREIARAVQDIENGTESANASVDVAGHGGE